MILFLSSITLEFMPAVPRSSVINVWLMRQENRSWSLCLYSGVKVQDSTDILFCESVFVVRLKRLMKGMSG